MRSPAVAGRFYPKNEKTLKQTVQKYIDNAEVEVTSRSVLAPHAGYPYSGACAGHSFKALDPVESYVLIGPCHHRATKLPAVSKENWLTPLGEVKVDLEFIDCLEGVVKDEKPHRDEHSIEVQLPFLQQRFKSFKIVPIAVGPLNPSEAASLAKQIERAAAHFEKSTALVVSSDLNHYRPKQELVRADKKVYDKILELDPTGFYSAARDGSVCGYGPILVAMQTAGINDVRLLDYRTSADVTGAGQPGVGYASMAFN